MTAKVPWNGLDVFLVYGLRFIIGWLVIGFIFPANFRANLFAIEVADRLVVLFLIGVVLYKYRVGIEVLGLKRLKVNSLIWGIILGTVLLLISAFSERLLSSYLLLTPAEHPIVAQVEEAKSWSDLVIPLFLAGLLAPVVEEILYRGFTFPVLKRRIGLWVGAFASALIFAALHFSWFWLPEMLLVGTCLAILYDYTDSLYSSICAHAVINIGKILILYGNFQVF